MFADYLRELQRVRLLTPVEEAECWRRFRGGGDAESRLRLIEAYQPLVFKLAMQLQLPRPRVMDFIQEGTVGLIEAVERFDPTRRVRFSTFAAYRIRGRMLNALGRRGPELSLDQLVADELAAALGDLEAETALARVEDRVLVSQVGAAIAELPEREREILRAFLMRREPRAVARGLRISLSHFYRLQNQAIARVRAMLRGAAPGTGSP
ncbi:MAG TPA: sigma-70 family RNA polymerase sigma factor [bacterium]|jgi:RNA polymerase sporulation-specific sigma factor|nr:sigma-70 family RNA polymerase sigma factor [bacterium]